MTVRSRQACSSGRAPPPAALLMRSSSVSRVPIPMMRIHTVEQKPLSGHARMPQSDRARREHATPRCTRRGRTASCNALRRRARLLLVAIVFDNARRCSQSASEPPSCAASARRRPNSPSGVLHSWERKIRHPTPNPYFWGKSPGLDVREPDLLMRRWQRSKPSTAHGQAVLTTLCLREAATNKTESFGIHGECRIRKRARTQRAIASEACDGKYHMHTDWIRAMTLHIQR